MTNRERGLPTLDLRPTSIRTSRELPFAAPSKPQQSPSSQRRDGRVTVVAVAACSSNPADAPPPTIAPAPAADLAARDGTARGRGAPARRTRPGQRVRPATADAWSCSAAIRQGGSTVTSSRRPAPSAPCAARAGARRSPATATARSTLSTRGGYFRVDVARGAVTPIDVDGARGRRLHRDHAPRRRQGRRSAAPTARCYTLAPTPPSAARLQIFARVDALVAQGDTVVVLDRGQTSVTTVDPSGTQAEHALRAGEGATTIAADPRAACWSPTPAARHCWCSAPTR